MRGRTGHSRHRGFEVAVVPVQQGPQRRRRGMRIVERHVRSVSHIQLPEAPAQAPARLPDVHQLLRVGHQPYQIQTWLGRQLLVASCTAQLDPARPVLESVRHSEPEQASRFVHGCMMTHCGR